MCEAVNPYEKGGEKMAKSSGSRGGGKGKSRGPGGKPSTTGNPSGKYRDNAPAKGKGKGK